MQVLQEQKPAPRSHPWTLVTKKQHPFPIPCRIRCSFQRPFFLYGAHFKDPSVNIGVPFFAVFEIFVGWALLGGSEF